MLRDRLSRIELRVVHSLGVGTGVGESAEQTVVGQALRLRVQADEESPLLQVRANQEWDARSAAGGDGRVRVAGDRSFVEDGTIRNATSARRDARLDVE